MEKRDRRGREPTVLGIGFMSLRCRCATACGARNHAEVIAQAGEGRMRRIRKIAKLRSKIFETRRNGGRGKTNSRQI